MDEKISPHEATGELLEISLELLRIDKRLETIGPTLPADGEDAEKLPSGKAKELLGTVVGVLMLDAVEMLKAAAGKTGED